MKTQRIILFFILSFLMLPMWAQEITISGHVEDDFGELSGVNIVEIDQNDRVLGGVTTDMNGDFFLKARSDKNRLRMQFVGYQTLVLPIKGTTSWNVKMKENVQTLTEAVVTAERRQNVGMGDIPTKQVSMAISHLDFGEEIEGISTASAEDVLQGRVAGLDIVAASGAPGAGSQMRIRGTTTLSGNANPLIVLNEIPFEGDISSDFDFNNATDDQYADLLCVNVDDIQSIDVLKDASATALYGSKGSNGVIKITTKKGKRGKPIIKYSYKLTEKFQPSGMKMLSGDDYTMLMKQAYFNRTLASTETYAQYSRDEYNYNPSFSEYEQFNNNTDWIDAVTQHGWTNDHYLSVSGGGERATFLISGGYLSQSGTSIGQDYTKVTSRMNLEYDISKRIKVITEFQFTYSNNYKNLENYDSNNTTLLGIAYKKMPNVGIYRQDENGVNTDEYYNIRSDSKLDATQRNLFNPVALANLAKNQEVNRRILPTVRLQYNILNPSLDNSPISLRYSAYINFDVNNLTRNQFLPASVSNFAWDNQAINNAQEYTTERLNIQTENKLALETYFSDDHKIIANLAWQTASATQSAQTTKSYGHPGESLSNATSASYLYYLTNGNSTSRSLAGLGNIHYSYKGKYILSGVLRVDGSTKFGEDQRWGIFPGVSAKWILSEEKFFEPLQPYVSFLAVRPGWGITGNQPSSNYSQYSVYSIDSYGYMGGTVVRPTNIPLTNLRWEKTQSFNLGLDVSFFDNKVSAKVDLYDKKTTDMLWSAYAIASSSGFSYLNYKNGGKLENKGWELEFNTDKLIKKGKFSLDFNLNFGNNKNVILDIDESIMNQFNDNASSLGNGVYLTRIQKNNAYGSIYGFRYKGVYSYSFDNFDRAQAEGKSCPVAYDADGNIMVDYNGNPKQMMYDYNGTKYKFQGGDVMYEDINHDGSIDEYDVVYLGNSNPKLEGGFGTTLRYGNLSMTVFCNFRYGGKVVNYSRMTAENMYTDNNQCTTVNWRWRKEGDVTDVPRAVYQQAYNWLGSDRYVENGSFLRIKYISFRYSAPKKWAEAIHAKSLSGYVTTNNPWVFTKYSGTDPEVAVRNFNSSLPGVAYDTSRTPRSKDWTLGLSVTF
ncbi:MAG: SusC/RagA family TonB-linked outer membrane protein [Bacteroidales bacterium]|nr:SusC/RagA family TonB-linked outer membrane protein [Bacteroidales bacterium]